MTKLKRPERYVQFESIKPELKEITEFYTRKTADYQYRLKQLNEYADALENEISVLKETPRVEVLLDNTAKQLVVIPRLVADFIESENHNEYNREGTLVFEHYNSYKKSGNVSELQTWIANNFDIFLSAIVNGYTVEKEQMFILKHIDMSKLSTDDSLYLAHGLYKEIQHVRFSKDVDMSKIEECHFNQSEIDELNIGSYEQIEVKVDEVE